MTIGDRIKQRRIELGLTQEEVAKKCGYKSRSSVNKIELSRDLPLNKVELMANALECSPGYLMGWTDDNVEMEYELRNGNIVKENKHEKKALELYEKYEKADPNIKAAIEALLKGQ